MASIVTNRGRYRMANGFFRNQNVPAHFHLHLCTSAVTPTVDTNTLSELTQIANGNGYDTAGVDVNRDTTDFDSLSEDDALDKALLQLKDYIWTATGGSLPASGNGARWLVLCDDNVTVNSRDVLVAWDLASDKTVSETQTLTAQNCEIDVTLPAA